MAFTALSFGVTHVEESGDRDAPAIVFVNSLGTDLRIWNGVVERLRGACRIVTYDKRGHGLSAVPSSPYSIAALADDLRELADQLGLDRFALVGVSVGGLIAQRFAVDWPERLAALVLSGTAARIGDASTWNARIEAVRAGGMAAIADAVLLRWFPASIREGRDAEMAGWRNLLLSTPVEGYLGTCAALRDADLTEDVSRIAAPTLAMVGDADEATPPALVQDTARRIAGARFETIAGAGHIPSIDRPATVAALVRDHLKEHGHG